MDDACYRKLVEHLDTLPGGFASTETGEDVALLRTLFTPEEAELAVHLTLDRETPAEIAERAGLPPGEVEPRLEQMSRKGLIFPVESEGGPTLYQAAPFVVGIYEYQVNNLRPELLEAIGAYWKARKQKPPAPSIRQIRTIPVRQRVDLTVEALPYERVDELLESHDRFAVAPCICRRHAKLGGAGCDAPEEACLIFDEWADFYVRDGRGRYVERSDIEEIVAKADEANLVLQPSNSQHIAFLCCCCSCCCGILRSLKHHPKPSEVVVSSFIAQLDADGCTNCETCLDRCPMEAITAGDTCVELDTDRCIGCGLCVSTCPSEALSLTRKPGKQRRPPDRLEDTWRLAARLQARQS